MRWRLSGRLFSKEIERLLYELFSEMGWTISAAALVVLGGIMRNIQELEKRIGYVFHNRKLILSLIHI